MQYGQAQPGNCRTGQEDTTCDHCHDKAANLARDLVQELAIATRFRLPKTRCGRKSDAPSDDLEDWKQLRQGSY